MKKRSSFTNLHVVSNLYDILQKGIYFEECWGTNNIGPHFVVLTKKKKKNYSFVFHRRKNIYRFGMT